MKRILCTVFFLSFFLITSVAAKAAVPENYTFFSQTQYPTKVWFLHGDEPGPTVLVQGGIQGDEISGYVAAQILAKSTVKKGNLILVPRANVPSVHVRKRQINVDMNRRFDQDYNRFFEDRVARLIRFLLPQADAFIHLHEGSGFYNPKHISTLRNPNRYGQSFIIDTWEFKGLKLGEIASKAMVELNKSIKNPAYRFSVFNTKTFESAAYEEQRKSLTAYTLHTRRIPAMAVEVSKDIIQLPWKVRKQVYATQLLLKEFGVDIDLPEISDKSILSYNKNCMQVRVNGKLLQNGIPVEVRQGNTLQILSEGSGDPFFDPAVCLFASDRPAVNLLNMPRMVLHDIDGLEVRSDGRTVLSSKVKVKQAQGKMKSSQPLFVCWVNGEPRFVRSGEVLTAVLGDRFSMEGVWDGGTSEILNLKGFVAIPWANDGQDVGWEIILDPDNFLKRYQVKNAPSGVKRFRVDRETKGKEKASFYIDIQPRQIFAVRLLDENKQTVLIPWVGSTTYDLPAGKYTLDKIWSNGEGEMVLVTTQTRPLRTGESFTVAKGQPLALTARLATTFAPVGDMVIQSN
ncbi:MAG: M99 family carboxypeptidase catalytic domain-containing protein [Desulfovibrio sp.]